MKKTVLILIMLLSIIGYSQTNFTLNGITYALTSSNSTAVITDYVSGAGSDVNIPPIITIGLTYDVIGIESSAFYQKGLTSVVIPNSIITIGSFAFRGNNLTSLIIPNSVTSIGIAAFRDNQLENLVISNSITNINAQTFLNNNLVSVVIPNSVTNIGTSAFTSNQLTSITIPSNVTNIDDFSFYLNPLTQVISKGIIPATITTDVSFDSFSSNRSNIDLIIPNGTTSDYAASLWTGFNSVTEMLIVGDTVNANFITYEVTSIAPDTVEVIGYDMAGGVDVNLPATFSYNSTNYTVTSIKFNSFDSKNLSTIIIPNTVTVIGANAFSNNQLSNVVIPDAITVISSGAFSYNNLTSITIPENVVNIQIQAFKSNSITDIISMSVTPPNLAASGSVLDPFDNHNNINLILPNSTTDEYVTDSGALWTGFKMVFEATTSNTLKVTDYDATNSTIANIPDTITDGSDVYNITEIGDGAFFDKGLTSVTIPNGIINIGTSAFNTNNLTNLTIPDSVISIGSQAFVTNSISNLTIGNSVSNIGLGAFVDNSLTNITIPSSVTNIDAVAFAANPLVSVTSLAITPPTIITGTNDTFNISGDRSNIHLHIPSGSSVMGAYVTNAGALWTGFNPVTQDALGISDFELANDIKIITTTDEIKVIFSNNIRLQNYTIYNISGAKVATGNKSEIPTTYLVKGIYILKMDFDKGIFTKKIAVY